MLKKYCLLLLAFFAFAQITQAQSLSLVATSIKTTDDNGGYEYIQDSLHYVYYAPKEHTILPFFKEYGSIEIDLRNRNYPETDFDECVQSFTSSDIRLESRVFRYRSNEHIDSTVLFVPENEYEEALIYKYYYYYNAAGLLNFEENYVYYADRPAIGWGTKHEIIYAYDGDLLIKKTNERKAAGLTNPDITTDNYDYNDAGQLIFHDQYVERFGKPALKEFEFQYFYDNHQLLDSIYYEKHSIFSGNVNYRQTKKYYDPLRLRIDSTLNYRSDDNNSYELYLKEYFTYNAENQLTVYSTARSYYDFEISPDLFFSYNEDGNLSIMSNCPGALEDCSTYRQSTYEYSPPVITASEEHSLIPNFVLYPNPVRQSFLNIKAAAVVKKINIIDDNGRIIKTMSAPGSSINVSFLATGKYICQVYYENKTESIPFMKL